MSSNTKSSPVKAVAPFKPTAQKLVNSKGFQRVVYGKKKAGLKEHLQTTEELTSAAHSTSDEENIKPAQEEVEPPSSPLPLSGSILGSKVQERDTRAYEHERQRNKRAAERAANRARKATYAGPFGVQSSAREGREANRKTRGRVEVEVDEDVQTVGKGISVLAGTLIEGLSGANSSAGITAIARANANAIRSVDAKRQASSSVQKGDDIREVTLSDLVVQSQRKARKTKVDDYELVPAVRTVIVLDDMPSEDMDLDEPWEHVALSSEDNNGKEVANGRLGEHSYAAIAAAARLD
ncbi:hypothetical protein D9619_006539 [Psilocybe cf. subviscida]|uniref:Uncharacterized protein n=1 Tax=Psilocybe cf. subviscida TaxID=2480587 RepID=A0A8H5EXZ0_9AGAR|nr:hypothetical protein D9619_006539 [Psilocybe cf. subviscida]